MAMEADASMQESSEDASFGAPEEAAARSSKSSKPGGGSTPRGTLPGLQVLINSMFVPMKITITGNCMSVSALLQHYKGVACTED